MKFNCGFSILILLFNIFPSIVFAVECPTNVDDTTGEMSGSKTCYSCVFYMCTLMQNKGSSMHIKLEAKEFHRGVGCPYDFYDKCSNFTSDIDFIRNKSPNNLDYGSVIADANSNVFTIQYNSGCGDRADGTQCLKDKADSFNNEIELKKISGGDHYENGFFYWNDGKDSHFGKSADDTGTGDYSIHSHNGDPMPYNENGNRSNQNGAFKAIGFLVFGWILVAWFY